MQKCDQYHYITSAGRVKDDESKKNKWRQIERKWGERGKNSAAVYYVVPKRCSAATRACVCRDDRNMDGNIYTSTTS